jgi:hypothetical protein
VGAVTAFYSQPRVELLAYSFVYTVMATKKSFIRTKLLEVQCGALHAIEPYAAVRILDSEEGNGQGKLIQKKQTFYPNWGQCFDSHISKGRQMGIAIHDQAQDQLFICEVVTEIESLAEQCRGKPNQITRLTLELKPQGKLSLQVKLFGEKEGEKLFSHLRVTW